MSIVKFFFNHIRRPAEPGQSGSVSERDPLAHPDLAAMSTTELADLPLAPENFGWIEVARHESLAARCR